MEDPATPSDVSGIAQGAYPDMGVTDGGGGDGVREVVVGA